MCVMIAKYLEKEDEPDEMDIEGLYELIIVKPYRRKNGILVKWYFRNYPKSKGVWIWIQESMKILVGLVYGIPT